MLKGYTGMELLEAQLAALVVVLAVVVVVKTSKGWLLKLETMML